MSDATVARHGGRRPIALLGLGAVVGIALAVASLLSPSGTVGLPEGALARVNSTVIRESQFERAVAAMASDRRTALTSADRRHVLDRLIDEELLVQYGLALGLAERDRRVRSDLVSAVLASQVASVDGTTPSDDEVLEFYRENEPFFRSPGRLRVRSLWIRAAPDRTAAEALARAEAAVERLRAGEAFDVVAQAIGDRPVAPVPDGMLPPAKLREYVGPSALRVIDRLVVGDVSDPLVSESAVRVFLLVDRELSVAPAIEVIANEVRAEMKRRAGDDAVRSLLDRLRESAALELSDRIE
ncbi:MAG: SurA N-terminal domain-containing protein [Deltaproteobacteria bacterium]|nr:SurA N-terminal domain-containing protein [Deltaproteobacteria bacterium]MBW2398707.1 SurA N-terminal domain-containing protein [Deltaproteobacteria bacterium]